MEPVTASRVLFIAHEFPPSAGGGVQRLASFAHYLTVYGWEVHVIAAEPLPGKPRDESLLTKVAGIPVDRLPARDAATAIARTLSPLKALRAALRRPRGRYKAPQGGSGASSAQAAASPLSARLSRWVALPDGAVFWSRRVPDLAARLHQRAPFDLVFASGPPYSALLAGARVGRRLGLPVVLDMRDAWKYSYHARWPTVAKQRRFEELEREAIDGARVVVTVNEAIAGEAAELGAAKTVVLPNGFDPGEVPAWSPARDRALNLVFMGRMSPGASDPSVLFRSLARAREIDPRMNECHLTVIGPDAPWAEDLASHLGVRNLVSFGGFRPYREALDIVAAADLGVIALAEDDASAGVYSGKLFDYVGIGIPILVFGPEISGAAEIARETGCGHVIAGGDVEAGARILLELAEAKRQGVTPCVTSPAVRARFDRREQVRMLSELLRETARR